MTTLEFGKGTKIDSCFWPSQTSDGTVFYMRGASVSSIGALFNGQKMAKNESWDGSIDCSQCFGGAFYFKTETNKIYTATFHPPKEIRIDFIRELEEGESCSKYMLLRKKMNGKEVIYRACDDPKNG
ncbi:hypothetical protein PFISCL1PPCAC_16724, partial [Pristionchus fissidentatus]